MYLENRLGLVVHCVIKYVYGFRLISAISRQLPERSARSIAVRRLEGFEEAADVIYHEIEEDDVAQFQQEAFTGEEIMEEGAGNDEIVEDAEDWVFHENRSVDENDDEGDHTEDFDEDEMLIAADGTHWSRSAGRRPATPGLPRGSGGA